MELEEQLIDFAERIQSGCGPYVSYDEVQQWPKGRLEELLDMDVLIATTPAKKINCTECSSMDCPPIEPSIETFPGASEPEGAFLCKKEGGGGLIRIPLERMKRWEIVKDKLIELGYLAAPIANETDEFITLTEAGILAGVHKGTVSKWADAGQIEHNGVKGRGRKVSKASVLMMKHEREEKQAQGDYEEYRRDIENIPDMH